MKSEPNREPRPARLTRNVIACVPHEGEDVGKLRRLESWELLLERLFTVGRAPAGQRVSVGQNHMGRGVEAMIEEHFFLPSVAGTAAMAWS